jgi:hypothetical protein
MSDAAISQTLQSVDPESMLPTLTNLDREINDLEKQYLTGGVQKPDYEKRLLILKKRRKDSMSKLQEFLKADPEAARQLRFRLYANRTVQVLLSGFIGGMVKELSPNFDSDRKARYPILENIDETTARVNPSEILDELAYAGILGRRLYERLVCCPKCGSNSSVFIRLKCPECGSMQLDSGKLVEHLVCGAVHEFEECANDDQIKCPSCQEPLVQEGEDFRVVGTFEKCESCRVHLDEPAESFACRACQEEFSVKEATYYNTFTYTLNGNVSTEVKGAIGLPVFKTALEEFGFEVEFPGTVTGTSGMIHNFALSGRKNGRSVVIDFVESESEVDEKELFAFYTKALDLKSTLGMLIAVPHLSNRAREFASKALSRDDVIYIEASSHAQAIEQLKTKLQQFV